MNSNSKLGPSLFGAGRTGEEEEEEAEAEIFDTPENLGPSDGGSK